MKWRNVVELLILSNTPPSIISPFPAFAISLFLISIDHLAFSGLPILLAGITVSLFSNFASNLWNHCNDLKEDTAQGKRTILTFNDSMRTKGLFIAAMLYAISILLVYYLSIQFNRPIYLYFLIWAFATWWYSDNIILKKITGIRLKEHFMGEFLTYASAWPMYTMSIWLIYSDLNATGVIVTLAFLFLGISTLLLKDLKDISGDREAGLRTLGVIFMPSGLIRYSCYLMVLYYLIFLNPVSLNFLGADTLIMMFPFVYFLKNVFLHMQKKQWNLGREDLKAFKSIGNSIYASVIFLGLSAII